MTPFIDETSAVRLGLAAKNPDRSEILVSRLKGLARKIGNSIVFLQTGKGRNFNKSHLESGRACLIWADQFGRKEARRFRAYLRK